MQQEHPAYFKLVAETGKGVSAINRDTFDNIQSLLWSLSLHGYGVCIPFTTRRGNPMHQHALAHNQARLLL